MLNVTVDANILDIIKIQASGLLELNTTSRTINANGVVVGGNKFLLALSGSFSTSSA